MSPSAFPHESSKRTQSRTFHLSQCAKFRGVFLVALLILSLSHFAHAQAVTKSSVPQSIRTATGSWDLTWNEEFDGPDGFAPDLSKWTIVTGGNGWGNNELEYYTARPQNVQTQNGNLVITAAQEEYTGPDGVARSYTSARLNTATKFEQTYGRFEARIKIPAGQGIWPAFWLLGGDIGKAKWPACGEIDIMENIGREPSVIHGTIHGPGYSGAKAIGAPTSISSGQFSDDYHVYAVEWEPNEIRFYMDGDLYETRAPADLPPGTKWVYDHPFFIILNVAVGGGWPGNPDATSIYPQKMFVDYVRVYTRKLSQ
jgi:beta-glucanase (GH16 family)